MSRDLSSYFTERCGLISDTDYNFSYRGKEFFIRYNFIQKKIADEVLETHEVRIRWSDTPRKHKFRSSDLRKSDYDYIFTVSGAVGVKQDIMVERGVEPYVLAILETRVYPADVENMLSHVSHNPVLLYESINNMDELDKLFRSLIATFLVDRYDYKYREHK